MTVTTELMEQNRKELRDLFLKAKSTLPHRKYIPKDRKYYVTVTQLNDPIGYIHIDDRDLLIEELERLGVFKNEDCRNVRR